jgi:hypothetical protein
MTKEELATERNEVREILEDFSEELSQSNIDELSRVFCIINGDEKRIADLKKENAELKSEKGCETCTKFDEVKLTKAKDIINELLMNGYDESTRAKALDFLYPDKE